MKILFIVVDTLRADHLGCYGYERPTSPDIDKLAQRGVLFSSALGPSIPTIPAFTVMYTGLHGLTTGIISHGVEEQVLDNRIPVLPRILQDNGYITAAVDNLYDMKNWFARGYDYYVNPRNLQLVIADKINEKAIPWIKQNNNKDFFLFVHYWDPHTPYLPPEKYRRLFYQDNENDPDNHSMDSVKHQLVYPFFKAWHYDLLGNPTDLEYISAQYDSEIRYVDEKIGELLYTLDEVNITEDALVLLTSDHGENMTEHDFYFDHQGLYEPTIRVPLILKWPKRFPQGKKVHAMVQHLDYAPTILDILKIPKIEAMEGKSLLSLINGSTEEEYQEIHINECTWRAARAIRTKEWKFIKTVDKGLYQKPMRELYNLQDDPQENHNLVKEEKDVVDELEIKMQRWLEEKLGNNPDPLQVQAKRGLPGKTWLEKTLKAAGMRWDEWLKRQKYI